MRQHFADTAPPEALAVMDNAKTALAAAMEASPGLGVGDAAPAFSLPDQDGNTVSSADLLARGPLLLVLFRGHW